MSAPGPTTNPTTTAPILQQLRRSTGYPACPLASARYVDTTEPVDVMSVEDAPARLPEAERRRDEAVARMDELLAGMGYSR